MRISDWSSDVCSSDLPRTARAVSIHPSPNAPPTPQPTALRTAGLGSRQEGLEARSLGRPQSRRRSRQAQAGGRKRRSPLAADGRVGEKDRKSVVEGRSVSVRLDLGGPRNIKKKKKK